MAYTILCIFKLQFEDTWFIQKANVTCQFTALTILACVFVVKEEVFHFLFRMLHSWPVVCLSKLDGNLVFVGFEDNWWTFFPFLCFLVLLGQCRITQSQRPYVF